MPKSGSVNQMLSSDLTTMSFGALSRLPSNLSASTVILPSFSVRVMRRGTQCSQVTSRPWRARAWAVGELALGRETEGWVGFSSDFLMGVLGGSGDKRK